MQLSVIILNYNVRYFLELCVLSVQKAVQNLDAEIIVIDNNSSDDSCAMMKQRFQNIKLIENNDNFGFPKGNNIAVAAAKGEYICILNPDTVVAEDTFEKVLAFAKSKTELGIVGCKLIDGTGNFLLESKRGIPTPWVAITKIFGLYKIFPNISSFNKYYAQHLDENQTGKVDILVGAFMVMKRDLYNELGGFDENCFMYSDDIDLSYRSLQKGKSNYYFHETTVIHYKGESTVRDKNYIKHFRKAMQFFYNKHFRKSIVFDFVMKCGSFIFSVVKKNQQKNRIFSIDETILFTKGSSSTFASSVDIIYSRFDDFRINSTISCEIIFDTTCFTYKEIISFMEKSKSVTVTFKNFLPSSNVVIGSNHANDIGQVLNLSKLE
ncbi:glycosyltransferase family 2 protein [Flavobacterium sp.]|uniref:glycosyltransferase family 2 protein n=1 Tax=Flavobacterium sp. TaxID=239 RepID=UPI0025EB832D|nr:glycosyltransferase family 2 protein [Flavobacterium sp.]